MRTIKVKFKSNPNKYSYLCEDPSVAEGSHVVVDSPRDGYVVVKVVEVAALTGKAYKHIVCKVEDVAYLERAEKLRKAEELLAELVAMYEQLAKSDSTVASLLQQLKSL